MIEGRLADKETYESIPADELQRVNDQGGEMPAKKKDSRGSLAEFELRTGDDGKRNKGLTI